MAIASGSNQVARMFGYQIMQFTQPWKLFIWKTTEGVETVYMEENRMWPQRSGRGVLGTVKH
jgi:hypothetical protein